MYKEIKQCRICGNHRLIPVLDLGLQALTAVFPKQKIQPAPSGPLTLVKCHDEQDQEVCGLVQLRHSFDSRQIYAENYGYRSGLNQTIVTHLQRHVANILNLVSLEKDDVIVDIGSNDGTLLAAYPEGRFELIGIDPTAAKFRRYYRRDINCIADFFSADKVYGKKAKAVTSIAMFYDVESPLDFMKQVYDILDDQGVWVLEQSYLPSMLKKNAYDTICHEHLEYYSLHQIKWMTDRAGFKIIDITFNEINGGSFCVTTAKQNSSFIENTALIQAVLEQEKRLGLETLKPYQEFEKRILEHRGKLRDFIRKIRSQDKTIIGYGASTKGNVLLQFCGLTEKDISYVAEVNEEKFGCFCPGSNIPIISEQEARKKHPDYFFVLPWHFKENFLRREKEFLAQGGKFLMPLPEVETIF
jgi:hypothetical protein